MVSASYHKKNYMKNIGYNLCNDGQDITLSVVTNQEKHDYTLNMITLAKIVNDVNIT